VTDRSRILVVEDERNIAEVICENLEAEGYEVEVARDGEAGLERLLGDSWDLVVLDVMMPKLDGLSVCQQARAKGCTVPVLFLTARGTTDDRIAGLEAGGDDYLPKPFHLRELLLRVEAILRRGAPTSAPPLEFGGNRVDLSERTATTWDGVSQRLPRKEARILEVLAEQDGEAVSREDLLSKVWGSELLPSTRVLDGLVEELRRRFERDPAAPAHLHTVRGVGYRFTRYPSA
jgi:two-component system alkaline phosphatase synthesis response regulator PhoP